MLRSGTDFGTIHCQGQLPACQPRYKSLPQGQRGSTLITGQGCFFFLPVMERRVYTFFFFFFFLFFSPFFFFSFHFCYSEENTTGVHQIQTHFCRSCSAHIQGQQVPWAISQGHESTSLMKRTRDCIRRPVKPPFPSQRPAKPP